MANTVPLNLVPDPSVIQIRAKHFWLPDGRQVIAPSNMFGASTFTGNENKWANRQSEKHDG